MWCAPGLARRLPGLKQSEWMRVEGGDRCTGRACTSSARDGANGKFEAYCVFSAQLPEGSLGLIFKRIPLAAVLRLD